MVKLLIDHGADTNVPGFDGENRALLSAIANINVELIKILLPNKSNQTALQIAQQMKRQDLIALLTP